MNQLNLDLEHLLLCVTAGKRQLDKGSVNTNPRSCCMQGLALSCLLPLHLTNLLVVSCQHEKLSCCLVDDSHSSLQCGIIYSMADVDSSTCMVACSDSLQGPLQMACSRPLQAFSSCQCMCSGRKSAILTDTCSEASQHTCSICTLLWSTYQGMYLIIEQCRVHWLKDILWQSV